MRVSLGQKLLLGTILFLSGVLATTAQTPQPTVLFSFTNTANGMVYPRSSLTLGPDGHFYGTTLGDNSDHGTVFRITANGAATKLATFNGSNGSKPTGDLALGTDGHFYGTTVAGGSNNFGTVFRVTTSGVLTTLVNFNGPNGRSPWAGLTPGNDNDFFGTTMFGGSIDLGTVFRVTTDGIHTVLHNFEGTPGSYPWAGVALAEHNALYGTATAELGGTVFKLSDAGVLATVATFESGGGNFPLQLTHGDNGSFYGVQFAYTGGSVFKVAATGKLTTLITFARTNGTSCGPLRFGPDGNIYGMTVGVDELGEWIVFKLTPSGNWTILAASAVHNIRSDVPSPGGLTFGNDGSLYGMTMFGGDADAGTVFRVDLPPTVMSQPSNRFNGAGTTATFSVAAFGTAPFSYQWLKDGTNLVDGPNVSGANAGTLTLANVQPGDAGDFTVIVINIAGSITSSVAALTVLTGSESAVASLQVGVAGANTNTLTFAGVPNTEYVVQYATNLTDSPWFTLATNTASAEGTWLVIDPTATNAQRFYRVVAP